MSGEFGRNPKSASKGDGSDHAPDATNYTFFSGSLAGNEIIGDTLRESGNTSYPGTWCVGATNGDYGKIGTGHIAATISKMLKVNSPVTSSPSLVKETNGTLRAVSDKTHLKIHFHQTCSMISLG